MKKVLLTQSKGRLQGLVELLEAQGLDVRHQPFIETLTIQEARAEAEHLLNCEWMLFSSQTGVEAWLELSLPFPENIRYGAVGNKTVKSLKDLGLKVDIVGKPQNAEGLAELFIHNFSSAKSVALPKGNLSLSILEDKLELADISTKPIVIYRTKTAKLTDVNFTDYDALFFASPSAVAVLKDVPKSVLQNKKFIAIGETTAQAIFEIGYECTIAVTPSNEAITKAIVEAIN